MKCNVISDTGDFVTEKVKEVICSKELVLEESWQVRFATVYRNFGLSLLVVIRFDR